MLVVQSHIECEEVQSSIVTVRLWNLSVCQWVSGSKRLLLEDVMFGDEVSCARVQASSKERREDQVVQGIGGCGLDKRIIKCDLDCDVECVDRSEGDLIDHHWAESVEQDLESCEKSFPEDRIEEYGFERGWEISIETIHTERLVMR